MRKMKREIQKAAAGIFLFIGIMAALRLSADMMKITLPPETGVFKPAPGSQIANSQCLTCHSVGYVLMQPPLSLKTWTAEVKKMKTTFGAPIPEDQIAPVAEYLAENYGTETNNPSATASETTIKTMTAAGQPVSAEVLATRYGCLNCHKMDVKVVGPAFKDVRAKYLNDPEAVDKILQQIHHGGSGKWGPAIMPPFPGISDVEAKKLAAWIMSEGKSN
jgi:cytochrome c551/c552